jgi:WS/DGAT/MGAT family acyltransferase
VPAPAELVLGAWTERLTHPGEIARMAPKAMGKGQDALERARDLGQGLLAFGKAALEVAPRTSLNAPIGAHRRFEVVRADLAEVKAIRRRHACKVNDVILAAVAGGLRRILVARGEDPTGLSLRALVPVSVRDPSQRHTYGNLVSGMMVDLPVGEPDPVKRLLALRDHMAGMKESKQAVGADFWVKLAEYAPPTVVALASRAVAFQRMVNLCVTNVPGPQFPLYLLGGQMIEAFPFIPLVGTVAVGVAIISYNGQLNFGITGDWDVVPDLGGIAEGIRESLEELRQ